MKKQIVNPALKEKSIHLLKKRYYKILDKIKIDRDKNILQMFKIYLKAYLIGKKIYGRCFTYKTLARDLNCSRSTVQRIICLRYVNENTWKNILEKKISVYKVSEILVRKSSKHFQDEMIKIAIDQNLNINEIKAMARFKSLKDCSLYRNEIAIKRGYTRGSDAYKSFDYAIERLKNCLGINIDQLPENTRQIILRKLIKLNLSINKYIEASKI